MAYLQEWCEIKWKHSTYKYVETNVVDICSAFLLRIWLPRISELVVEQQGESKQDGKQKDAKQEAEPEEETKTESVHEESEQGPYSALAYCIKALKDGQQYMAILKSSLSKLQESLVAYHSK